MIPLLLLSAAPAFAGRLGSEDVSGLDQVYEPRRVAVVVGVDEYADPALTSLRFAAKDATDLADVLDDPEIGGFDRVVSVTGQAATTREGIEKVLRFATADLQRDDTFLLYLSGHGTLTVDPLDGSRLWFLPSDGLLAQPQDTGIPVTWLEEQVNAVEARRRVLIMDTCHNGRQAEGARSSLNGETEQVLAGLRGEPPAPRSTRQVSESEARLYAAEYHQPAMEDGTLENGVYTHFLIQAMTEAARQADLDGDGLVDVTEAHDWARDKTMIYTGGLQTPRAEYRIVGREEIYLAGDITTRSGAERALLAATDQLLASAQVLVDGQPRGVLPDVVALEPGTHTVELQDDKGRTLLKRTLRVSAGETIMVEDLFPDARDGIEMVAGGIARHGGGAGVLTPLGGEIEATLVRPGLGPRWMLGDVHIRGSYGYGELPDQGLTAQSGGVWVGGTAAWRPQRVPALSVGPSADVGMLWRQGWGFQDGDQFTSEGQSTAAVAPGLRAAWRQPIGRRNTLTVRYDVRAVGYLWAAQDKGLPVQGYLHHGLAIGVGFR